MLCLSCPNVFSQKDFHTPLTYPIGSIPGDSLIIYSPGKSFVFKAIYRSTVENTEEYIVMTVFRERYNRQNIITYFYYDEYPQIDENFKPNEVLRSDSTYNERTLIFNTIKGIWIHPPRQHYNTLTQYFPFPEIDLPVKENKKYRRDFLSF